MDKLRAVNLGGWLVLERWMNEELFSRNNVKGNDETVFMQQAKNADVELSKHHQSYIQFEELDAIKEMGVNLVRLPIPWWLFGEVGYHRSVEFLDQILEHLDQIDLDYMLDLHTAPGCQNGFDNGGIQGVLDWPKDIKNIDKTIDVLEQIAMRYKSNKNFHSIQLLNEPHISIDQKLLIDFYERSYTRIRKILPTTYIVMHDGFRLHIWEEFFKKNQFKNVILDTHMYQCFDDSQHKFTLKQHVNTALKRKEQLAKVSKYIPVIVGEWSLGVRPNEHIKDNMVEVMKAYASAQIQAMSECAGHVFWSYKARDSFQGWCFKDLVDKKIIDMKEFLK